MLIRPYNEADLVGVIDLWSEAFPGSPSHNNPTDDIKRKLDIQRELFIVAEDDGRIIGSAMAGFDGHRGWVYYVAVRKSSRRRQIGRKLMKHVETALRLIGCTKLNLQIRSDNNEVLEFYQSLGYSVEDRISMGKHLKSD